MKNVILIKENDVVSIIPKTAENIKHLSKEHLCWENCKNCTSCPKVLDENKKEMCKYSFIKSGYQVYGKKGLDTFFVSDCTRYEKDERKKHSMLYLKNLKEDLKKYYNDDEALESSLEKTYVKHIKNI